WMGVLSTTRRAGAAGLRGTARGALLHLLGHALRALAQGFERAALRIDRAIGVLLAERAFGIAHGLLGPTERVVDALALLALLTLALLPLLSELAAPAQLLEQLLELSAQRLL